MEDRPTRAARSQLGNRELLLGAGAPSRGFATAGPKILGLAQSAYSNSTFDRGSLSPTYIKPFDVFARGAKLEIGSPHWTISATGSFEKRPEATTLRHYYASFSSLQTRELPST